MSKYSMNIETDIWPKKMTYFWLGKGHEEENGALNIVLLSTKTFAYMAMLQIPIKWHRCDINTDQINTRTLKWKEIHQKK